MHIEILLLFASDGEIRVQIVETHFERGIIHMGEQNLRVFETKWSSNRKEDEFYVDNPAIGENFALVRGSGKEEVDACVKAADAAFNDVWRWIPPHERGAMLKKAARVVEKHFDEIAELETEEEGKALFISKSDTVRCVQAFDYFGGLIGNLPSELYDLGPINVSVFMEPYGVVAGIIPFNWPPLHTAAKIAPALAAGNTIVLKPGDQAPLSVLRIVEILQDVFPPDVLSVIAGPGATAGQALTSHPLVRKIAFTGSSNSGRAVLRQAAENITPCIMELGGKNALLIMPGCNIDELIPVALQGAFYNNGQACSAASRIIVHRSLHDEFVEKFSKAVRELKVGDGMNPENYIGPLVSKVQQQRVLDYIDIGLKEGAKIVAQAPLPTDERLKNGYFVPPTLFDNVTSRMRIAQEEMFGPITCVIAFDDPNEAAALVNDTAYGLVAVVYSPDQTQAMRIARQLDVGMVYVNNFYRGGLQCVPFGGNKNSGYGRERCIETLYEFCRAKSVRVPSGIGDCPV